MIRLYNTHCKATLFQISFHFFLLSILIGTLRIKVKAWFTGDQKQNYAVEISSLNMKSAQSLHDFPIRFSSHQNSSNVGISYDDEDLFAWSAEAERWARVFFLYMDEEHHLEPLFRVYCFPSMCFVVHLVCQNVSIRQ